VVRYKLIVWYKKSTFNEMKSTRGKKDKALFYGRMESWGAPRKKQQAMNHLRACSVLTAFVDARFLREICLCLLA
jgi:hypothetical protein